MKDKWTGDAVGKMHVHEITELKLAEHLKWHPKYLSSVLNCRSKPKSAEEKVMSALDEMIAEM